jgi:multicomponent Na+:H+ antiporter subunit E
MAAVLILLWQILAQNAGWTFGVEAVFAVILTSMFFGMLLPAHYNFSGLILFACYFLVEALRGGVDVAWRTLSPKLPIAPVWLNYSLTLPEGSPRVLFLNCVSLLPGTLSVALKDNVALVHSLNASASAETELARLEYWVMRVFAAPGRGA